MIKIMENPYSEITEGIFSSAPQFLECWRQGIPSWVHVVGKPARLQGIWELFPQQQKELPAIW